MSDWIVEDPEILGSKPCVRETRIRFEHILELIASGASREAFLEASPQVTDGGLPAALAYAAKTNRQETAQAVTESG